MAEVSKVQGMQISQSVVDVSLLTTEIGLSCAVDSLEGQDAKVSTQTNTREARKSLLCLKFPRLKELSPDRETIEGITGRVSRAIMMPQLQQTSSIAHKPLTHIYRHLTVASRRTAISR